jgi:hypothetical protein
MASDNITMILAELGMRLEQQEQRIQAQARQIAELLAENERLKQLLHDKGASKGSKPPKFSEDYSIDKNKGNGKSKRGHQATGRRPQESKLELVEDYVDLYEAGVEPSACVERRRQYVWRIIDGKARYICYRLFAQPESKQLPTIAGVRTSLSEYGLEIILIVAFLHYWVGISIDHACGVVQFFTGLALTKSQANSLLEQLSHDWQAQYDVIAELLAYQMVIYIDETGWQVGRDSCYTWAFSTAMHVLFRCGVGTGQSRSPGDCGRAICRDRGLG